MVGRQRASGEERVWWAAGGRTGAGGPQQLVGWSTSPWARHHAAPRPRLSLRLVWPAPSGSCLELWGNPEIGSTQHTHQHGWKLVARIQTRTELCNRWENWRIWTFKMLRVSYRSNQTQTTIRVDMLTLLKQKLELTAISFENRFIYYFHWSFFISLLKLTYLDLHVFFSFHVILLLEFLVFQGLLPASVSYEISRIIYGAMTAPRGWTCYGQIKYMQAHHNWWMTVTNFGYNCHNHCIFCSKKSLTKIYIMLPKLWKTRVVLVRCICEDINIHSTHVILSYSRFNMPG